MAHKYAKAFYSSKAWAQTRKAFMQSKYYTCQRCGGVAVICHHVKHINPQNIHDPNITLNWDNLLAVCQDCHAIVHGCDQVCREDCMFTEDGQLVARKYNGSNDLIHSSVKPYQRGVSKVFG